MYGNVIKTITKKLLLLLTTNGAKKVLFEFRQKLIEIILKNGVKTNSKTV